MSIMLWEENTGRLPRRLRNVDMARHHKQHSLHHFPSPCFWLLCTKVTYAIKDAYCFVG